MDCRESVTKRCRTRFNSWQVQRLEQVFLKTHYPDVQQMEELAIETDIQTSKMQIWFQNRRAKWRKNSRLKNFGGLGSVKETEYVPAPHMSDTLKFLSLDLENYRRRDPEAKSNEENAIDLRMRSLSDSQLCMQSMPTTAKKLSAYKKSGGITGITGITSTRLNDHMNAFEYPPAYYSKHYMDNKEMPFPMPFPFASNQTMTSLLFAPHLCAVQCIQSASECDSNAQNTDINK